MHEAGAAWQPPPPIPQAPATVASSQLLRTQSETHAPSKSHLLSGANSSRPDVQRQECLRYLMGAKRQCRAPAAFKHGVIRLPISLVSLITNAPSHRSDVHGDLLPRKASEVSGIPPFAIPQQHS